MARRGGVEKRSVENSSTCKERSIKGNGKKRRESMVQKIEERKGREERKREKRERREKEERKFCEHKSFTTKREISDFGLGIKLEV